MACGYRLQEGLECKDGDHCSYTHEISKLAIRLKAHKVLITCVLLPPLAHL